jgi:Zn-dependent peptidase ImmA (M78 family)
MSVSKTFSVSPASKLMRLFMERSGASADSTPSAVIENWVAKLRRKRPEPTEPTHHIDPFLDARKIKDFKTSKEIICDGYLEAIGNSFKDGFRMSVKDDVNEGRMRFTVAHELCHTFFYELVPELKFRDHGPNDEEEIVCNQGAAAFLIPKRGLKRRATSSPVCLETLESLANEYGVSLVTMFLRLRALGLWRCELSVWSRKYDGSFGLQRLYGGHPTEWSWFESSVPLRAWSSDVTKGNTFLQCVDSAGSIRFRPITYEAVRRGEVLVVLWGNLDTQSGSRINLPLFHSKS